MILCLLKAVNKGIVLSRIHNSLLNDCTCVCMVLHDFQFILLRFMLIYIHFDMCIFAFNCEPGVPNQRAWGTSATSNKYAPGILEHVPCVVKLDRCLHDSVCFVPVLGSPSRVRLWLPALQRPQREHAPGIWEHVACVVLLIWVVFCLFVVFLFPVVGSPSPVREWGCLRRLGNLRKSTPHNCRKINQLI